MLFSGIGMKLFAQLTFKPIHGISIFITKYLGKASNLDAANPFHYQEG